MPLTKKTKALPCYLSPTLPQYSRQEAHRGPEQDTWQISRVHQLVNLLTHDASQSVPGVLVWVGNYAGGPRSWVIQVGEMSQSNVWLYLYPQVSVSGYIRDLKSSPYIFPKPPPSPTSPATFTTQPVSSKTHSSHVLRRHILLFSKFLFSKMYVDTDYSSKNSLERH